MAINKKLVHFKKLDTFNTELSNGNILNTSIVFIQDANMIWTHGTFYPCPYTKEYLDSKFTSINNEFTTIALGDVRGIEVSISTTQPTEDNYLFWVNPDNDVLKYKSTTGEWLTLNVLKDPDDGKYYVRHYKEWVSLPTTETVNITLSSNQTNPDTNLNGATVTITYGDVTDIETWNGSTIMALIPEGMTYTVSVSNVEGYTKPEDVSYTAGMMVGRNIKFVYNTTKVNITYSFSEGDSSSISTASVKVGSSAAQTYNLPTTISVPTGESYTVTFSSISDYSTPESITKIAEGANQTVNGVYNFSGATIKIGIDSNLSEEFTSTATVSYNDVSETYDIVKGNFKDVYVPLEANYTISFSNVEGYRTPDSITGTAVAGGSVTETVTYQSEFATVTVNGLDNTPSGYTITLKSGDTVLGTSTEASKLFKIPFGITYTVEASSVTGFTTPAVQTFVAGNNTRAITVTYVYDTTIDLSMMDIHGNALSSRSTANCYIVREPGTYKFPLVYGNAIKNGQVNSTAYTRVAGDYTADFMNIKGEAITNPYIETDLGYAAEVATVSVCDTDEVFADLSIIDGTPCRFVQFTVKKVPKTGANGVISVYFSTGLIMWNWHIWVWEDDLTPKTITNNSGNKYDILPVNLGSKWDEDTKVHIKNWYYQWGRSVPQICPSAYNSNTKATSYGSYLVSVKESVSDFTEYKNFICLPGTFFKGNSSYNYNWINLNYFYNWWDANCTSTEANDNKVVKTVYDPCPVGYSVGNANVFSYFSRSNVVGSFNYGYKFKANSSDTTGIFFPASGWAFYDGGSLINVGSYGNVWSSALSTADYACSLYFYGSYVGPLSSSRRAGAVSIRPVKEQ